MPIGKWKNFKSCVTSMTDKLGSTDAAKRYCGAIEQRIHKECPIDHALKRLEEERRHTLQLTEKLKEKKDGKS